MPLVATRSATFPGSLTTNVIGDPVTLGFAHACPGLTIRSVRVVARIMICLSPDDLSSEMLVTPLE